MREFVGPILGALVLLLLTVLPAPSGAGSDGADGGAGNGEHYGDGVISYRTHGSLGMPPTFDLHLFEDGLTVYVGVAWDKDGGTRKTGTSPGHFIRATEMFGPLELAAAAVECDSFGIDYPATSVEMRTPVGHQILSYDYGCYPPADAFLEVLEAMESVLPIATAQEAERAQVLYFSSIGQTIDAPSFAVYLFADGFMIFDGRRNVVEKGVQRLQVNPETYRAVSKEFVALLALEKANRKCGPSSDSNVVAVGDADADGTADLITDTAMPTTTATATDGNLHVHVDKGGPFIYIERQTADETDNVIHDSGLGEHSAEFHAHLAKLESLLSVQGLIGRKQ